MHSPTLIALAKQSAILRSIDTLAANVSNASTSGFRRSGVDFSGYMHAVLQGQSVSFPFDVESYIDLKPGPAQATFNPLDLIIEGNERAFFVVEKNGGQVLTKNGQMKLDAAGRLVDSGGNVLVGEDDRPIVVGADTESVTFLADGSVKSADFVVGRLKVVEVPDASALSRLGSSGFVVPKGAARATGFVVRSGMLEGANVDMIGEISALIQMSRDFEMLQQLLSIEDSRKNDVIEKLPQV
ncbi:MAG: flagellar hook-basal body complex protein [Alphaproteobacteria bacterium]|nr:flagellar hook-basal body complex protein [Alphaproteobacteria bacterium]